MLAGQGELTPLGKVAGTRLQPHEAVSLARISYICGQFPHSFHIFIGLSRVQKLHNTSQTFSHLIQEHHDPPAMGHPGRAKTLELLQRRYYWLRMRNDVMRYI